jgi:hypothetical protein
LSLLVSKEKFREDTNMNTKNGNRIISTDQMNIKKIIKNIYKTLHAHKFDNLREVGQFFETTQTTKTHPRKNNYVY